MKESTSNFIMGFLAGAVAGAIAGILFAPDKGSATRRKLKKQVSEFSDEYGLGINEMIRDFGWDEENEPRRKAPAPKRPANRKPKKNGEKP